jgi:hypothetical protein
MPQANPEQPGSGNLKAFNAVRIMGKDEEKAKLVAAKAGKQAVEFPPHLYVPEGAESLDLRRVMNIPNGTLDYAIFEFIVPPGAVTRFISYGVFNDGDVAANYRFLPQVNGNRIFRYHGDPMTNFKIDLGLAPDLSNNSLIPCQLTLQPYDVLRWLVTNTSGVDTSMGVRMVGYFDTQQKRVTPKFG